MLFEGAQGALLHSCGTAERFVPSPFGHEPGQRLYRMGDLGRYLPEGEVTFVGRMDRQLQVRGFRVEPGEIEAALLGHPGVRQAVVLGWGDEPRLLAFVVAETGVEMADGVELRAHLGQLLPSHMMPSSFVVLGRLPLTASGKIDRQALREAAVVDRPAGMSAVVLPETPVEQAVAAVFSEVLEVDEVGRDDDFFELGGHSLLAVRLLSRLQGVFGVRLALTALFETSTVAGLAARIAAIGTKAMPLEADPASWSPLVKIRDGDPAEDPFFCVHPVGGTVLCYADLARHLSLPGVFYGLQAPGLADGWQPVATIEELAGLHVQAVRRARPEGPYHLGGWSMGGLVAWEMACQLREAGQEVALLALIDAGPARIRRAGGSEASLFADGSPLLEDLEFSPEELARIREPGLTTDERLARVWERARQRQLLPPGARLDDMRRFVALYEAHIRAVRDYRPRPSPVAVTLFAAEERRPFEEGDPVDLGWGELGTRIERISVPGNHLTVVSEPHVAELAECLRVLLRSESKPTRFLDI